MLDSIQPHTKKNLRMKKIIKSIAIAIIVTTVACGQTNQDGWKTFNQRDFSIQYP